MKFDPPALFKIPDLKDTLSVFIDWLELITCAAAGDRVLLAALAARIPIDARAGEEDIDGDEEKGFDAESAKREDLRNQWVAEIDYRRRCLDDAYPFYLSADGRWMCLYPADQLNTGRKAYLFALFMSHTTVESRLVGAEERPDDAMLIRGRWIFQRCACLAAAGRTGGPAHILWPPPDGTGFIPTLKQIWDHFGDGTPRDAPLAGTTCYVKDDGVDLVSWYVHADGRRGTFYLLGQVTTGQKWRNKGVPNVISCFHEEWFPDIPSSRAYSAMFVPFHVSSDEMRKMTRMLGEIFDRLRLPKFALEGQKTAAAAGFHVDGSDVVDGELSDWLGQHRKHLFELAAAS